jgi:hypothetical protein
LRLFHSVNYDSILPLWGSQVDVYLKCGEYYSGRIVEVRQDGILFHSSNPGFFFLPFAAIALIALSVPFAFGLGYAAGRSSYGYAYY